MSLRGGALCARISWVVASRSRTIFFFRGGLSGEPSWPAMKKLSFAGTVNGLERRIPVSFSPPGERLEIKREDLSPFDDSRVSRNQGLEVSPPLTGVLRHSNEPVATEANNRSARS